MKKLTTILFLLINLNLFAQNSLFSKYDLNKNSYALYCTLWWSEPQTELSEELLNFYIDDVQTLKELMNSWKVKKGSGAPCGYDYNLYLVENDSVVEHWLLNIECSFLEIDGIFYQIDSTQINILKKQPKQLKGFTKKFSDLDSARLLFEKIEKQPCIFIPPQFNDKWIHFNGFTKFERNFSINEYTSYDSLGTVIEREIQSELFKNKIKYDLNILLSRDGLGEATFRVFIYTNYPINKSIQYYELLEEWKPFNDIDLKYYQKKNCP